MFDNPEPARDVAEMFGRLRANVEDTGEPLTEEDLRRGYAAARARLAGMTDDELAELDIFVRDVADLEKSADHQNTPQHVPTVASPSVKPARHNRVVRRRAGSGRHPHPVRATSANGPTTVETGPGTRRFTTSTSHAWRTVEVHRTVLIAVHTVTGLMRLEDVLPLIEADTRVQLVFTQVPDQLGQGVEQRLRALEVPVLPWRQAIRHEFDLAVSASLHQMENVSARSKVAVPHGAGFNKVWPSWTRPGWSGQPPVYGLDRQSLLHKGNPVFDAIVLPHPDHLETLARQCPESLDTAIVAGDLCFDRLLDAMSSREHYRTKLRVRTGQVLVAVASTWGPRSLMATQRDLLLRLTAELPADHRIIMTLHPAVWAMHGPRQIRAWLRDAHEAGVELIDVWEDWRALVAAADVMIADHSSVAVYAAAAGLPLLLSHFAEQEVDPNSAVAELAALSPLLSATRPLREQLEDAREAGNRQWEAMHRRISSERGASAGIIRQKIYQLLGMEGPRPTRTPWPEVPVPRLVPAATSPQS